MQLPIPRHVILWELPALGTVVFQRGEKGIRVVGQGAANQVAAGPSLSPHIHRLQVIPLDIRTAIRMVIGCCSFGTSRMQLNRACVPNRVKRRTGFTLVVLMLKILLQRVRV